MNKLLFIIFCLQLAIDCSLFTASAQDQHRIDSLSILLKIPKKDTTAANILNDLSVAYWGSIPDTAMYYANQFLALSGHISYKKGIGNAYYDMGVIF